MNLDIICLIDGGTAGVVAHFTQIPRYLGLAIRGDNLAIGVARQVNRYRLVIKRQLHRMMLDAFLGQPGPGFGTVDQIDRRLFQNTGPDTGQHIVLGLAFQNDVVDARQIQKSAKKLGDSASDQAKKAKIKAVRRKKKTY